MYDRDTPLLAPWSVTSLDELALTAFALYGRCEQIWRTAQIIGYISVFILAFGMLFAVTGIHGRNIFQALGFPIPGLLITLFRLLILSIPTICLCLCVWLGNVRFLVRPGYRKRSGCTHFFFDDYPYIFPTEVG